MKMNEKNNNYTGELNLLIPNIDTTSERLPSENTPGAFLKNILTEKNINNNKEQKKGKNNIPHNKKIQKYSNNLVSRTMRNNQHNFSNNKENHYSQKETQDMTQKKNNINKNKSNNYNNIVKKINMISIERNKKENNKIPPRPKRNISNITNTDNKDSYLYLVQMKKNYSSNKLKDEYSTSTTFTRHNNKNVKSKESYSNKKNLTLNNFYPPQFSSKISNFLPIETNSPKTKKSNNSFF